MNGLRVYINPAGTNGQQPQQPQCGQRVFYSRRADGPYYCWQYQDEYGRWHGARVHLPSVTLRVLAVASWESVPKALQVKLGEHYLE